MKKRVGIVVSSFNPEYTGGLLKHCLERLGGLHSTVVRVPGAFEIPLAVQKLLRDKSIGAVIALGVIWQGHTAHSDLIGEAVTRALMNLMLQFEKPVIHQVLMVKNEKQARERCLEKKLNRGTEAADAVRLLLATGKPGGKP